MPSPESLLQNAKAIILDFDGTLVDSNGIKRSAFEKCFNDYPENFDAIMAYCKTNNHIPRKEKFRHVFEKILQIPYTAEMEQKMLALYAAQTTKQVIAAPEIPGATPFLKQFVFGKESALLSSTPHDVLLHILERRGMKKYFRTIQGAPVDKAVWIKNYLAQFGFKNEEVVFIGDSPEDIRSAKEARVPFIGVAEADPHQAGLYMADFRGL